VGAAPNRRGRPRLEIRNLSTVSDDPFGVALSEVFARRSWWRRLSASPAYRANGQNELLAAVLWRGRNVSADTPDVGRVKPVGKLGVAARRERGTGVRSGKSALDGGAVPDMTLADNGLLTAHRSGVVRKRIHRPRWDGDVRALDHRAFPACSVVAQHRSPVSLSGGNLQKFNFRPRDQSPRHESCSFHSPHGESMWPAARFPAPEP